MESEKLAYWYFRLNGFLTIPNFIVHSEDTGSQLTDVDILGIRFPYRAELLENPMVDDELFHEIKNKPYIILAEVKTGLCDLNGPWTRMEAKNIQRVLKAIGVFKDRVMDKVAEKLYTEGVYEDDLYCLSLFCIGREKNKIWLKKYPKFLR